MKKTTLAGLMAGISLITCGFSSCATTAPTALENKLYDVQTNFVTQVAQQTNQVYATNTVTVTNAVTQQVFATNVVTVTRVDVVTVTNQVPASYVFTPKTNVVAGLQVASDLGSATGIPYAGVIGMALTGLLGLWGNLRSSKALGVAQTVAAAGQQGIATAKSIISALPNGGAITTQYNQFLANNHTALGVAGAVATVIDNEVDPHAANGAAQAILNAAVTPMPVVAVAPAAPAKTS